MTDAARADLSGRLAEPQVALVDLLDRVLAGGVVIAGDVTLAIAEIPLIRISLRALIVSARAGGTAAGPAWNGQAVP